MARPHLLTTILAALAAAGCATEDTEMCLQIAGDAESCPAAEDVNPEDLFHSAECDLEARRVTGEAERVEAVFWAEDTGADEADLCCYPVVAHDTSRFGECAVGRPFVEGGAATVAPIIAGGGWAAPPDSAARDPDRALAVADGARENPQNPQNPGWSAHIRRDGDRSRSTSLQQRPAELEAAWTRLAAMEHASIAAFARLTLELMAHGAPAALLADVQAAAADEVDHARRCFAQASRHAGQALAPGPFPFTGPVVIRGDLAAIAADAASEGCVGETVGAALAAASAASATDPAAKADLAAIAADEARHAALSWRVVAWAVQIGGAPVAQAVRAALAQAVVGAAVTPQDHPTLQAHGHLGPNAHAAVVAHALRDVVQPATRALLGP